MDFGFWILDWKRVGLTAAALLAAFAVGACGGDDDDGGDSNTRTAASPTTASVSGTGSPQSDLGKKVNAAEVPEELAEGTRIGKADAKLTIEMYEDFGCPHCLDFTALIEPVLMEEYVATGKVALVYRYFPLRQLTAAAAIAAHCAAEQGKFWPYHRELFIAQAEANEKTGPVLTEAFGVENLAKIAANIKLDTAKYDACTTSEAPVTAVSGDLRKANELALPGTPSFIINGELVETPETLGDWRKLLDGMLK